MSQLKAKGCDCVCTCAINDKECLRSVVENICNCSSCCEADGAMLSEQSDPDETLQKVLYASSADEREDGRNVSIMTGRNVSIMTGRKLSESTLYRQLSSQERHLHLFCACSAESRNHLKQVLKLLKTLKNSGFEVRTDRDRHNPNVRNKRMAPNMQDWLDGNIARADFVIVCISPKYLEDIQAPVEGGPETDANTLVTRYIYDQLRAEYYINKCHHQKVIPVRFRDSYVPNTKIPPFMKTTIVYTYPNDFNDLINFLNISRNGL